MLLNVSKNLLRASGSLRSMQCSFRTTSKLNEIFTVQDEDDFKKRVLESDKPVIIDFYAK